MFIQAINTMIKVLFTIFPPKNVPKKTKRTGQDREHIYSQPYPVLVNLRLFTFFGRYSHAVSISTVMITGCSGFVKHLPPVPIAAHCGAHKLKKHSHECSYFTSVLLPYGNFVRFGIFLTRFHIASTLAVRYCIANQA